MNWEHIEGNWKHIEGNWKQFKDSVKKKWDKITDDEIDMIQGEQDRLAGKIQERYGIPKAEVQEQLVDFHKHAMATLTKLD